MLSSGRPASPPPRWDSAARTGRARAHWCEAFVLVGGAVGRSSWARATSCFADTCTCERCAAARQVLSSGPRDAALQSSVTAGQEIIWRRSSFYSSRKCALFAKLLLLASVLQTLATRAAPKPYFCAVEAVSVQDECG